jgi:hypothetical protein
VIFPGESFGMANLTGDETRRFPLPVILRGQGS